MSRGPGKWQTAILDELQRVEWFYVADLLPLPRRRSDYVALMRAANSLHAHERVQMWEYRYGSGPKVVVGRVGSTFPDRADIARVMPPSVPPSPQKTC